MSDGPTDFESGYLFESQKGISDRRAARGLPPHEDFAQGRNFDIGKGRSDSAPTGIAAGIGTIVVWAIIGALILSGIAAWLIAKWVLAPVAVAIFSLLFGGRQRRR